MNRDKGGLDLERGKKPGTAWSIRRLALLSLSIIVLPLFFTVVLFDWYAVKQQLDVLQTARENTLSLYRDAFDEAVNQAEYFTATITTDQTNFEEIVFAKSKTEAYLVSQAIGYQCEAFLQTQEMLSAFFIYSQPFDYNRLIYSGDYLQSELSVLRETVKSAAAAGDRPGTWQEVPLGDRQVLLYLYVRRGTVFAALIDPARQSYPGLSEQERVFYTTPENEPYLPQPFSAQVFPQTEGIAISAEDGRYYQLFSLPLSSIRGRVYYASPAEPFLQTLTPVQIVLLCVTACLLLAIPLCWLALRRLLLDPLTKMTGAMQAIQAGHTDERMPKDSRIEEVRETFETVNAMLDTISAQKINSYEQELEIQRTQMQCLQLQIRPHFFLNCLSMIYSLAGERKFAPIQALTLDLSAYFRNIFKDGSQLIPLETELNSVGSYIRLQQIGTKLPPKLRVDVDTAASKALVPPLSILTFVENAIKHSKRIDSPLEIVIQCTALQGDDKGYLNITITDNGGGFSEEQLRQLNTPEEEKKSSKHIGIANVRRRLRLLYREEAALCFMNLSDRASVELFLPLKNETKEGKQG